MTTTTRTGGARLLVALFGVAALVLALAPGATAVSDQNPSCPAGHEAVAKYNRVGDTTNYTAEYGGSIVTLSNTTKTGGDWTSTVGISWVFVKGGPDHDGGTQYDPPATSGSFSNVNVPPVGKGNLPDVSHVLFCAPTTTTTTEGTTTTTEGTTTTTEATTTTTGFTGQTLPPTTEAPTTTTEPEPDVEGIVETTVEEVLAEEVQALPRTGATTLLTALLGAGAVLAGGGMLTASGRRREEDLDTEV